MTVKYQKIKKLREDRADFLRQTQQLLDTASAENRDLTPEESERFDRMIEDAERSRAELDRYERQYVASGGDGGSLTGALLRELNDEPRASNDRHDRIATADAGWQDSQGRPVTVIGSDRSLDDELRSAGVIDTPAGLSVGNLIVAGITGRTEIAERELNHFSELRDAMSAGIDGKGGFLVPPSMDPAFIDLARNQSALVGAGAQTVDMPRSSLSLIRQTGDPTPYWRGESQEIAASNPTFDRLEMEAKTMAALVKLPIELIEDAPNAGQVVQNALAAALAQKLDQTALTGDGSGTSPRGLLHTDGVQTVDVGAGLTYTDFINMAAAVETKNGTPSGVLMNPVHRAALSKLIDNTGQYLVPPPIYTSLAQRVTNQCPDDNVFVGDFSQVLIGIRRGPTIEVFRAGGDSGSNAVSQMQVFIRAYWRGDIGFVRPEWLARMTGVAAVL